MPESPAERHIATWSTLDADRRSNWDTDFLTMAEHMVPMRAKAIKLTIAGEKITTPIFDSIGFTQPTKLAASLHANLSNPSTRWFTFRMRQPELNEINEVQDWLEDTAHRVNLALTHSNFHNEIGEAYLDLPVFGTTAVLHEEELPTRLGDPPTPLFTALTIGSYGIAENAKGRVDTLYYLKEMSARAAFQQFHEDIGKSLMQKYEQHPYDMVTLLHGIYPRSDDERKGGGRTGRGKPFASVWIDLDGKHLIREGGYEEFPGAVARWRKQGGEIYGRGQGHLAIPDIKTLNREIELMLAGVALDIAPPLFELDRTVVGDLLWEPSARNVVRDKAGVWTMTSGMKHDVAALVEARLEKKIREIFFTDQIDALPPAENPSYMTAFEVAKRTELVFRLMGPAYSRVTGELHVPIIERQARMLGRAGMLRPLPAALRSVPNAEMDIRFEGPLARAQEAEVLTGIAQKNVWMQSVIQITGDQSVADNFDLDAEAMVVARGYGVPATVTRGKDQVASIRAARQEAHKKEMEMQQGMALAEGIGKVAPMVKALKDGGPKAMPGGGGNA